jgi:hypothetical protein
MRRLALAAVITLLAGAAQAQELRDFCAQRPGRATPPCILDAGHAQVEVGLADAALLRHGGDHEDTDTFLAPALRYGLTPRFEIEASAAPYVLDAARGADRTKGVGDTTLGVMGALTDPDAKGAAASLLGFVTAPTATHGLGAGGWTGGVKLAAGMPLTDTISLGLTPEVDVLRDAAGGGTHLAYIAVGGLSRSFGPLSLGAELWGEIEDEPTGSIRRATADLTAALAIGNATQIDAGTAFGLTRATPDAEIYVGIARRF